MNYIGTRNNHDPVSSAKAIALGMVPEGGLFVPEAVPSITPMPSPAESYQALAKNILTPLLTDFSPADIDRCIQAAYNPSTFGSESIVPLRSLDANRSIMELWHGPTAAFKDIALQIMPHFLATAKRVTGDASHTVILVATSGDTGTAALEGFKNCPGISIVVFFPHEGVSEIQRLQMATVDGNNTHVVGVKGNFDDCQSGVKRLLGDAALRSRLGSRGINLSSANSINWGRLCPQIVYYFAGYLALLRRGTVRSGEAVDFCVPTGNFGNILAGYYAMRMGVPIGRLICASNRNKMLADFFASGTYDANREFFRTMSPSMDILISSNLERFLFEITGHDAAKVSSWSASLAESGAFTVDDKTRESMARLIVSGWIDEQEVSDVIGRVYNDTGCVLDTHTAVAAGVSERLPSDRHTIIASTASPYKFSRDVLRGMTGEILDDEFAAIDRVAELSGMPVHRALAGLRDRPVRHRLVIGIEAMEETLEEIIGGIPYIS